MITAARPSSAHERAHYYRPDGTPCYSVPCKSRPGEDRAVNITDCRKLGLLPSPTTILRLLHRPVLVQWIVEQNCLAVLTTPRREGESLDAFVERVIQVERVQDQERDAAAKRGKSIHAAIQDYGATGFITTESETVKPVAQALLALGRIVASEEIVVGDGYAGMLDCRVENPNERWVIDFKTCRKIPDKPYDEHKLQVAAYAGALPIPKTEPKLVRSAIFYISSTEPGMLKDFETDWYFDWQRFKLLLEFWRKSNGI